MLKEEGERERMLKWIIGGRGMSGGEKIETVTKFKAAQISDSKHSKTAPWIGG